MEQTLDSKRIAQLPLRELTRHGGEGLLLERFYIETLETTWTFEQKSEVMSLADDVVHVYHAGDDRDDKTYATHVLRVASRILSPNHFNIRNDPDLIIAALLHDVVEDHPERLLGFNIAKALTVEASKEHRKRALEAIAKKYDDGAGRGERIAAMVEALSNPIYDKTGVSQEQRQEYYREHVRDLMQHGGNERLIKLSDFIDNCLGLKYNPDPDLQKKLAPKYLPLIQQMREFVVSSQLAISVQADILRDLGQAEILCRSVIHDGVDVFHSLGAVAATGFSEKNDLVSLGQSAK